MSPKITSTEQIKATNRTLPEGIGVPGSKYIAIPVSTLRPESKRDRNTMLVFACLLSLAENENGRVFICCSLSKLASFTGLSIQSVRTCLNKLITEKTIEKIESEEIFESTRLTLCNCVSYTLWATGVTNNHADSGFFDQNSEEKGKEEEQKETTKEEKRKKSHKKEIKKESKREKQEEENEREGLRTTPAPALDRGARREGYDSFCAVSHVISRSGQSSPPPAPLSSFFGDAEIFPETPASSTRRKKAKKKESFIPPTIEEVRQYVRESGCNLVDPDVFWRTYDESDWYKANGMQVRNWKKTVQTWQARAIARNAPEMRQPSPVMQQPMTESSYVDPYERKKQNILQ